MSEPRPPPATLDAHTGGTGPPVVLLHGLGGDRSVWNSLLPLLEPQYHTVAVDLRGHGRSPLPPGSSFSFPELEDDLVALLDRLGLPSAHLVGMSAGGFLALRLALDHPQRLRSLTLIGSAAQCDGHTRAIATHWAEVYRDEGFDAYALRLLKDLYYPDWIEAHLEVADHLREAVKDQDLRGAILWGGNVRTFDVRGELGRLRLPALILHGMDDRVMDSAHARYLRQSIPGAQLKLFPRTGHFVPIEHPSEVAEAIGSFVARVESLRAETPSASTAGSADK
ncbi:MAG: alpha/beta fold hydrolase [Thermoplasmata archaeon]|nr:alpha/beta fold hydrolase [Thermoplasmata archaeon]